MIASDEMSSEHFSMPQATIERNSPIDEIVALRAIPAVLAALTAATQL